MKSIRLLNHDFLRFIKNQNTNENDFLTGLPNRRAMYARFVELPKGSIVTVMIIDIDNFRRVNDVYGHSEADEVLKEVAGYLKHKLSDAKIFRVGGDEFAIFLGGQREDAEILGLVSNLSEGLRSLDIKREILAFVSLSVGIVANQPSSSNLDELLNRADAALYHAKENGKNSCVMYKTLSEAEKKKQLFTEEMSAAFSHNEFVPFLLPKINLNTGRICGAEVLCRWNHWIDGLRMPMDFLTVFENNGFITTLDFYMLEEACKMISTWVDTPMEDLVLAVNISSLNLYFYDLADRICEVADRYKVPHSLLEFEITEDTFSKSSDIVSKNIKRLVDMGFIISVDNFCGGSASLSFLQELPIQHVDFEKEFLKSALSNERGQVMVRNLLSMVKELNLMALAEGVETSEQADLLKSLGCERAQGYLFSAPIPEEDFIKFALSNIMTTM